MKKFILLLSMLLIVTASFAQSKVGTINADFIIAQMPELEEVNKALEVYGAELQKDAEANFTKYEALVKNYQDSVEIYAPEVKQAREQELIALENELKGFQQKGNVLIQMKRNQLTKPLYEKINTAMLKVIAEEGFTQILHAGGTALAYSAEEFDITLKVLEEMGIELKEQPVPAEAQE